MSSKEIIQLSARRSKEYFLEGKNYINFDIPDYFDFTKLLYETSKYIGKKDLKDLCKILKNDKPDWPKYYNNVNYTILSNKDGAYAWRPFQIMHPVLYIDLVNLITKKENWSYITKKFKKFKKSSVDCISIPKKSTSISSHKSVQVKSWWEKIEQKSLEMSLEYEYIFSTDISDCYGSIYTHSLEWALSDKSIQEIKSLLNSGKKINNIGSEIDTKLMGLNFGQTNGIPQGSVLMDFIAEIVLGYTDIELTNLIEKSKIKKTDYYILRYRDDYRIFSNNPLVGKKILQLLNSVLHNLNMKMNPGKTSESNDLITSNIKSEKLERIYIAPTKQTYQKEALRIYQLSKKYPNSGIISTELSSYYDSLKNQDNLKKSNLKVLISIFTLIAFNSPRVINWVSAIISILLKTIDSKSERKRLIKKIHNKFNSIPNTGLIDIWLQRISAPLDVSFRYKDSLTKIAINKIKNTSLWESNWLKDEIVDIINSSDISTLKASLDNKTIDPVISRKEVELFKLSYN